jgi:hypothetical protein
LALVSPEIELVKFFAKLLQDDQVVAKRVAGTLVIEPGGAWSGHFDLPPNYHLHGGKYRLVLDDGRSAEINLTEVASLAPEKTRVLFAGLGRVS